MTITATGEAIRKVDALQAKPSFMIHTGDITSFYLISPLFWCSAA